MNLERYLQEIIPDLMPDLSAIAERNMRNKSNTERTRLTEKFELIQPREQTYFNPKWVKNISSRELTESETKLLGRGLKFTTRHSK